ncbi:hypothetical protein DPMN_008139 [Dreissena polymorpha]|uniref:Uncharacterized protein n=1 Tax=Dreissena polymorpha TaxID=45954 RepID=A0A9D4MX68_DREPO|nr:hypothetical protein DPMN_008139 [Dreissena polymorpha]
MVSALAARLITRWFIWENDATKLFLSLTAHTRTTRLPTACPSFVDGVNQNELSAHRKRPSLDDGVYQYITACPPNLPLFR